MFDHNDTFLSCFRSTAQENIGPGGNYDEPDQVSWSPQLRFKTDRLDLNARWAHVEDDFSNNQIGNIAGFSLHAGVATEARQRKTA